MLLTKKERKKERKAERKKSKTIPRPPYRGRDNYMPFACRMREYKMSDSDEDIALI